MTLKDMYNNIGDRYAVADRFGSISISHACAIEQISRARLGQRPNYKVLDLGVGNGAFLKELEQCMPKAIFTGIDVSAKRLSAAKEKLRLTTIEASATEACHLLPLHSQDLVLAHFINAYIPINTLFNQAKLVTRSCGHFSLITTTYDSFPVAQRLLADFITQDSVLSRIVGHYYKAIVKNTTVAAGQNELMLALEQHQFNIVEHERIKIPVTINNIDELVLFGIEGTWFLNSLSIKMLPKHFLLDRLKRLFSRIFTFPYHDTHIIDVVLAQK